MKKISLLFLLTISTCVFAQTAEEFEKMAEAKIQSNEYQYAMVLIDKAIALDKKNQWYYLQKADIQFKLSGPGDALKIVKSAMLLDKKNSEPYNRAGSYYDSWGMADSAISMYNQAIKLAKNDTIKHSYILNRGTAKVSTRDFESAVKDYEMVLAFSPKDIGALNNIASCYGELGRNDKSIESLKKIIQIDPGFLGSYINLGFTYSDLDSLDLSLNYFNQAIQLDPKEPVAYNNRGNVYYKKGDYPNALKDINLSISMYPTNAYAYRNLALVYIAMNKMREACSALVYANDLGFEQRYGPEVGDLINKHCK